MSDPDVCATSDTLRKGDGDSWCLRSEGRQKLKRGHFNHRWFYGQEAAVLFQLMARAMTRRSRKRFTKRLELAIYKSRCEVFLAPEVIIESALRRVYCRSDAVNTRLDIADVLKEFAGGAQKHFAQIVLSM